MRREDSTAAPDWLNVSRETLDRLDLFASLVQKWNPAINLVSKRSLPELWKRHLLDSAQLYGLIPKTARNLADLGSGGGFPGLVLAILAQEDRPDLLVTLVEADRRKAVFLSEVVRQLSLRSPVIVERIEVLAPLHADVVTARALAPLATLCGYAYRHLVPGGLALFSKGSQVQDELLEAQAAWSFSVSLVDSRCGDDSSILTLSDIRHG